MSQRAFEQRVRKSQVSRQLAGLQGLTKIEPPSGGWIRAIRQALGMSGRQLAKRMSVSSPALARFEKGEVAGSITLRTLRRAADALECDVVYAFVPRAGSLDETISKQARKRAQALVDRVSHTMALESQEVGSEFKSEQVARLADELTHEMKRDLWKSE